MQKEEANTILYKHTTPSGKVYVGITNQIPEHRWNNGKGYFNVEKSPFKSAIIKYGWDNIKHEILVTNLTRLQAINWERRLIKHYKNLGISLNSTDGGEGVVGRVPWNKGSKGKMSSYWKGKKLSEQHKLRLRYSHLGKPTKRKPHTIYVYDCYGSYLNTFYDISSCCEALNIKSSNLCKAITGERNHVGGYQFRDNNTKNIPLKYLDPENYYKTYPIIAINKRTKEAIYMESMFALARMLHKKQSRVLDKITRLGSLYGMVFYTSRF